MDGCSKKTSELSFYVFDWFSILGADPSGWYTIRGVYEDISRGVRTN